MYLLFLFPIFLLYFTVISFTVSVMSSVKLQKEVFELVKVTYISMTTDAFVVSVWYCRGGLLLEYYPVSQLSIVVLE